MAESLKYHASSLKHLEINDNFYATDDSVTSLCDLIRAVTSLEHLNLDSSSLEEDSHAQQLLEAIVEAECKTSLKYFSWSYDAFEKDDLI